MDAGCSGQADGPLPKGAAKADADADADADLEASADGGGIVRGGDNAAGGENGPRRTGRGILGGS